MRESEVFEHIYRGYLKALAKVDLNAIKSRLRVNVDDGKAVVPFYGVSHRISAHGITDNRGRRPSHSVSVILCKYLLLCPETVPTAADWVTYKDFKDAVPFAGGFVNNAERPISQIFSGRLDDLRRACADLTGQPVKIDITADLVVRLDALPRVPILLVFNDRDEDFPAHCSLLFERRAEKYLDMECLAMIGWALSEWLKQRAV
jgi:hypothetical protein